MDDLLCDVTRELITVLSRVCKSIQTFTEAARVVKDASGNILEDGDTVTIAKDLKVKGSSTAIKVGTKVRNIRLISPVDGHDIDAKVDGFGQMMLKSSVVKKVL